MRRFLTLLALFVVATGLILSVGTPTPQRETHQLIQLSERHIIETHPLDNMPVVGGGYGELVSNQAAPVEQRGEEFRRWLCASVKISVTGASGSGTICYYDHSKNTAYVATCGHLWNNGAMSAEEGERKNMTCKVIIWYQNERNLDSTKEYPAKVIFYSHRSGCDTGLITFQPDWVPTYYPIAPLSYQIAPGSHQHSCGCDGGREVAHYDVEIVGPDGKDLITKYNSPRPGRSGGGLMTDDGYYIGTCWGTSRTDGSGIGYFTPVNVIHEYWRQQRGYEFLLNQPPFMGSAARQLPIINRSGPPMQFPQDYIPLPGSR
jgi:hypothetical protein